MATNKYQLEVTLARDLIPRFLAALERATEELRKHYKNPKFPSEMAGHVGVLVAFREIIALQFEADKAA